MARFRAALSGCLAVAGLLLPLAAPAQVDLWVTNTGSHGAGSFAAALAALDPASPVQQRIRFGFNTTVPVGISNVIHLNGPLPDLDGTNVLIDGSDVSAGVIIDGGGHPILTLPATATTTRLQVSNLVLRRGGRIGRGGCMAIDKAGVAASLSNVDFEDCRAYLEAGTAARGGALFSASGVAIADAMFLRNEVLSLAGTDQFADAAGGALAFETAGAVTIERSLFQANRVYLTNTLPSFCASGHGGAIAFAMAGGALVQLRGSSFIENSTPCRNPTVTYDLAATGDGGAVVIYGTGTHRYSGNFFSGNLGRRGGGIGVDQAFGSTLEFVNNTFTGNRGFASGGGVGVINCCVVTLHHNTFIDNLGSPTYGSQVAMVGGGLASMRYNALSGATPTCTPPFSLSANANVSYNAYSDAGCDIDVETDAQVDLGPLPFAAPAMLGGDVLTMAPVYGSTMIDAGPPGAACADLFDARGVVRPIDGDQDGSAACDVGAIESSYVPPRPPEVFADGFEAAADD